MTLDILRNYCELDSRFVRDLHHNIDDPCNALTLEANMHLAFDMFEWCLKATEVCAKINLLDTTYKCLL